MPFLSTASLKWGKHRGSYLFIFFLSLKGCKLHFITSNDNLNISRLTIPCTLLQSSNALRINWGLLMLWGVWGCRLDDYLLTASHLLECLLCQSICSLAQETDWLRNRLTIAQSQLWHYCKWAPKEDRWIYKLSSSPTEKKHIMYRYSRRALVQQCNKCKTFCSAL